MKEKRDRKQNIIIILLVVIILILISPALLLGLVYYSNVSNMGRNPVPTATPRIVVSAATVADMIDDSCAQIYGDYYSTELDEEQNRFMVDVWLTYLDDEAIERTKSGEDGADITTWNNMVRDLTSSADTMQRAFRDNCSDDITVVFSVCNPEDHNIKYLTIANGIAGYDVVNGIDLRGG